MTLFGCEPDPELPPPNDYDWLYHLFWVLVAWAVSIALSLPAFLMHPPHS